MRLAVLVLAAAALTRGVAAESVAPALAGWELITPENVPLATVCHAQPDGSILVDGKPVGYLQSPGVLTNFRLHVEWRWPAQPGNGGLLVAIASGPLDRNLWPRCLQIQTKHTRAGDLLPMAGATFAEKLSTPPDAKTPQLDHAAPTSERPAGEWNSCDLACRDGTIEVTINGVAQNRATHLDPASGRIGLQLEGTPFEFRALRVEPL